GRYLGEEGQAGIGDGLRIAGPAVGVPNVAFMLGDNIFIGSGLGCMLAQAAKQNDGASVFVYEVANPEAFGTINLDSAGRAVSIVEKPKDSTSRYAVTGLYLYGPDVMEIAAKLSPSQRGELEITDVNRAYLERGRLKAYPPGRGYAWLEGGPPADLFEASQFIRIMEARTGLKIGCPEEVAYRTGLITLDALEALARRAPPGDYSAYLLSIVKTERVQRARPG